MTDRLLRDSFDRSFRPDEGHPRPAAVPLVRADFDIPQPCPVDPHRPHTRERTTVDIRERDVLRMEATEFGVRYTLKIGTSTDTILAPWPKVKRCWLDTPDHPAAEEEAQSIAKAVEDVTDPKPESRFAKSDTEPPPPPPPKVTKKATRRGRAKAKVTPKGPKK